MIKKNTKLKKKTFKEEKKISNWQKLFLNLKDKLIIIRGWIIIILRWILKIFLIFWYIFLFDIIPKFLLPIWRCIVILLFIFVISCYRIIQDKLKIFYLKRIKFNKYKEYICNLIIFKRFFWREIWDYLKLIWWCLIISYLIHLIKLLIKWLLYFLF